MPELEIEAIAPLLRHRSVRSFSEREVPESWIRILIGAGQSAATSSHLQLTSVVTIRDADRRAKLAELCGNQSQVREAPWFFAFLADTHRLRSVSAALGEGGEGLDYTEYLLMAAIDAALMAERMVCAAEALGLGICYIGGLRNDAAGVADLLKLPTGILGVFGMTLGFPAEGALPDLKPRLRPETVWHQETYRSEFDPSEFDARMADFYTAQGQRADVPWSARMARRTDDRHLTGREALKEWLASRGLGVR